MYRENEEFQFKHQTHMASLAERLDKLDRENLNLRKQNENQRQDIEKLNSKLKKLQRNNSKSRKRRNSSQKRERSRSKEILSKKIKVIAMLQQEVGGLEYKHSSKLPANFPYLIEEEKYYISNLNEIFLNLSKEDTKLLILATKAVARIKTLSKICKMLTSELSEANKNSEIIEEHYKKVIEEGVGNDKKLRYMQKDFSTQKYQSNLNSTSLSQRNSEFEQSNLLMSRKFSYTQDGKLSSTIGGHNDSHMINSAIISPEKDFIYGQKYTDRDFKRVNYSPVKEVKNKSRNQNNLKECQSAATLSIHQLQKARIPESKNIYQPR